MSSGAINLSIRDDDVQRDLEQLEKRAGSLDAVLDDFGNYMVSRTVRRLQRGGADARAAAGEPPYTRTGASGIAGTITYQVLGGDRVAIGTNREYGEHLQEGGTISRRPGGPLLTIPVDPEARGKRAREFTDLQFVPSTNANPDTIGVLARVDAAGNVDPLFALAQHVTTKPHPFLFFEAADDAELVEIVATHLRLAG